MEIDFENHASASNVANPGSADNANIADMVNADIANNAALLALLAFSALHLVCGRSGSILKNLDGLCCWF